MPSTLTAVDVSGSCTERGTDRSAPWWKTSSTPRTAVCTRSYERRSPSTTSTSRPSEARFARLPVEKLSSTRTSSPRSSSASTRFEPMNPAPPVTSTFGHGASVRHDVVVRGDRAGPLVAERLDAAVESRRRGSAADTTRRDGRSRVPPQDVFEVDRVQHRERGGRARAGGHRNRSPVAVLAEQPLEPGARPAPEVGRGSGGRPSRRASRASTRPPGRSDAARARGRPGPGRRRARAPGRRARRRRTRPRPGSPRSVPRSAARGLSTVSIPTISRRAARRAGGTASRRSRRRACGTGRGRRGAARPRSSSQRTSGARTA